MTETPLQVSVDQKVVQEQNKTKKSCSAEIAVGVIFYQRNILLTKQNKVCTAQYD